LQLSLQVLNQAGNQWKEVSIHVINLGKINLD